MTLRLYIAITMLIPAIGMSACIPHKPTVNVFSAPGMSDAQFERFHLECDYEARKAVASQEPGLVRQLERRELYLACLKLKGAKYLRTEEEPS
jgi:hypothetical protein